MKRIVFFSLAIVLLLTNISQAFSKILYVRSGASGIGNSWTNAMGDLQAAINESADGDQIWVASGTYIPNRQINNLNSVTTGNRNNAFVVSKNIQIYGGFLGHETEINGRNNTAASSGAPRSNQTILSGVIGSGNLYHVLIFASGCDAIFDGFTIEGGNANGNTPVVINGKEYRQDAGGGVLIMHSSPKFNNVVIRNNAAVLGGGIYCFHSFPVLTNVVINNNSANQGGGIYNYYSFPLTANMTVSQNSGGGIYNAVSKPEITNSVVWGNTAGSDIYNDARSHAQYSYSLVQNEEKESDFVSTENNGQEDRAGLLIYVSPDGNDANAGTEASPLASLAGARDKVRAVKASGLPAGGIIVYFRGGTYNVMETTNLSAEDSGTESSPIIYKAYPGETPVFSGGRYIQGSKFGPVTDAAMRNRLAADVRDKVVCYNMFENGFTFNDLDYSKDFWKDGELKEYVIDKYLENQYYIPRMQVFMDDDAMFLARYPNKVAGLFPENPYNSYLSIAEVYGGRGMVTDTGGGDEEWDGKMPKFRIEEPRIRNWKSHEDIIAFGMIGLYYENERTFVKKIDTDQMIIELQSLMTYGFTNDSSRVAFENVFEELDRPGEYYIDKNTGILYLYPVREMKDATIKISMLEKNFMIKAKDVSYVTFSGITFELTKGSVFYISGGQNCTVENCDIKNFSIWGVRIGDNAIGARDYATALRDNTFDEHLNVISASDNGFNHKVTGCNFLNTGHHACIIASGHIGYREQGNALFENNVIKYSGLIGSTYRSGLHLTGAGITVKNNSFFYCLGQAIGGNFVDTEIIYNEFCDSPSDMAEDTGTIYCNYQNSNDGVKVRYNFLHDVTNMDTRFGLYYGAARRGAIAYDNNAPFRDFSYNVVYNYPGVELLSVVTPITCFNNIFIDCNLALIYDEGIFDMFKGKTAMDVITDPGQYTISALYLSGLYNTPLWKEKYPELYEYYEYMATQKTDILLPMDRTYDNLFVNIDKPFTAGNTALHELQIPANVSVDPKYGKISNNNYLFHDPGFPSVTNRNFQLSQAIANRYGMEWLDMSKIGATKTQRNNSHLPITTALVHNDTELKEALADGTVDAIRFANNITVNRTDLVVQPRRANPDLVIDGCQYTLTEFTAANDPSKAIRIEKNGTLNSIIVRSMNINGRNGAGNICIVTPESVDLTYRNVTYKGPKLAENVSGSILIDNSDVHITFAEGGGTYMGEAVIANKLNLRDRVNIRKDYDSDGTQESIIKLTGTNPSLIVETFPRETEVMLEYSGLETGEYTVTGGGGAIHAENQFDFIIESKAAFRYKGFYEFLTGAKVKRIEMNWNSSLSAIIYEDSQRGATDKVLSVEGDVTIGMASAIDIDVHAPAQCLLEVGGNLTALPGSYLWLGGYKYDPTIHGIEPAKYPVVLMKGGANSNIIFDRPTEIGIQSQQTGQEWMRSIGFVSDGTITFTAQQMAFTDRTPNNETQYNAANEDFITVEARIKGGVAGTTQSLSYRTENNALVNGGALSKENVDFKNITKFYLASDRDRLNISPNSYPPAADALYDPEYFSPSIGNQDKDTDPLFRGASAGDFGLKEESPLINAGSNALWDAAISTLQSPHSTDIGGNNRIIGSAIDIGAYEYDPESTMSPDTTIWRPVGVSSDWNSGANWTKGIPGSITNVIIPEANSYPVLTDRAAVYTILFKPGAELGRQDLLSYDKAFVEYDFGDNTRSDHYRMLSVPLMEAFPGDFTFGNEPTVYVQTLQVTNGIGEWVTAAGGNTDAFSSGTGFVISLLSDEDPDTGLGLSGGILQLPFYNSPNIDANVHSNHSFSEGTSTFTNPDPDSNVDPYTVTRGANGYRLAGATVNVATGFKQPGSSSFALVGNPYMTTINFDKLFSNNTSLIKNSYYVWTKIDENAGYLGYNSGDHFGVIAPSPLDSLIAPLQGFIVERAEDVMNTDELKFDLPKVASKLQGTLRSAHDTKNKLDIIAKNDKAAVLTFITVREGGSEQFGNSDSRKLMNSLSSVPDIYTLKPSDNKLIATGANITNSEDVEYPLGLATTFEGDITFTFSGMDNYDAKIFFTDKLLDKEIELTNMSMYEYKFDYTPPQNGAEIVSTNDRFSISINSFSGVSNELACNQPLYVYANQGAINVISKGADIQEVKIYNLHGMALYLSNVNDTSHKTTKRFTSGVYIVSIKINNSIIYKKVIIAQ